MLFAEARLLLAHVLLRQEVMVNVDPAQRRRGRRQTAGVRCGADHRAGCRKRSDETPPIRHPHNPIKRAITRRWTSFVPSPISLIFWSRYIRETGYSSMKP